MTAILKEDNNEIYKIVTVIQNPIPELNGKASVRVGIFTWYTKGILCEYHESTIETLNTLNTKEQYEWLRTIKSDCIVRKDETSETISVSD